MCCKEWVKFYPQLSIFISNENCNSYVGVLVQEGHHIKVRPQSKVLNKVTFFQYFISLYISVLYGICHAELEMGVRFPLFDLHKVKSMSGDVRLDAFLKAFDTHVKVLTSVSGSYIMDRRVIVFFFFFFMPGRKECK